jgi:hypothetical protein
MDIVGGRKYVEISGDRTHELPPLLVRATPGLRRLDRVVALAAGIVESEDMVASTPLEDPSVDLELERRRLDLALNLVEEYRYVLTHWKWGDSILEWIRQCEITFETRPELRNLLRPDLWPHAGRSSFVTLLEDKAVPGQGVDVEKAVGLRLTFRQPPPISCFSDRFLFLLKATVAAAAYETWARMNPEPIASLPPERFHFEVVDMAA